MSWTEFDNGNTYNAHGTEGGYILKDEELDGSARITLEELSKGKYAVTCGIYGTMVHTAWFDEENALLKYKQMKSDIENILSTENDDDFYELIEEFVDRY